MNTLERIRQMKKNGLAEQQIISQLEEEGINPKEIKDAFNQAKIKDAIEGEEIQMEEQEVQTNRNLEEQGNDYIPQPQLESLEENYPQNQEQRPAQNYFPQTQQYSEEYYPQEGYSEEPSSGAVGTDTIIEVAEQVFEEKIKKIENQLNSLREFSTLAGTKLSNSEERIKRIELIMDNLQIKILEKISSYGENLNSIKKEMSMMQDSFSKTLPGLAKKQVHESPKKISKKK